MEQSFGICKLSSAPLRSEPADKSEMISQVLFGDHFEVLELAGKWMRIRMAYDGYEGWMDPKQAMMIEGEFFDTLSSSGNILGLEVCHPLTRTDTAELLYLLPGSSLPELQNNQFEINGTVFKLQNNAVRPDQNGFTAGVDRAAMFYLNSPYLWGGRSPFGIDCSGFSQMVFKQFGIRLKRDAWQQALQGDVVDFLQEARAGDLAFFDNEEGRITHVGIMLQNDKIIHASGHVRVDPIDDQGIYNRELSRYTHKLRVIKRFVS